MTFKVTNTLKYSRAELTAFDDAFKRANGEPPNKEPLLGLTHPDAPLRNYTGYDSPSPMQMLETQVHELGHSLDAITRIGYDDPTRHGGTGDLAGTILSDCVKKRNGYRYK